MPEHTESSPAAAKRAAYERLRYQRDKEKRRAAQNKRRAENLEKFLLKERAANAKRRRDNPRKTKSDVLRALYGITLEDYERMAAEQGGACAICDSKAKLHVDHCHSSGVVRGLLCASCNRALGHFEKRGLRMAAYLKKCSQ